MSHVHVSACALHAVTHAVRVHEGKGHQTQGKAAKSSCVLMRQLSSRSLSGCTRQGMPEPVARQPLRAAELHQPPQRPPRPFRLPTHPEPCRPAPAAAPRSLQRRALAQPGVNHLHPRLVIRVHLSQRDLSTKPMKLLAILVHFLRDSDDILMHLRRASPLEARLQGLQRTLPTDRKLVACVTRRKAVS